MKIAIFMLFQFLPSLLMQILLWCAESDPQQNKPWEPDFFFRRQCRPAALLNINAAPLLPPPQQWEGGRRPYHISNRSRTCDWSPLCMCVCTTNTTHTPETHFALDLPLTTDRRPQSIKFLSSTVIAFFCWYRGVLPSSLLILLTLQLFLNLGQRSRKRRRRRSRRLWAKELAMLTGSA